MYEKILEYIMNKEEANCVNFKYNNTLSVFENILFSVMEEDDKIIALAVFDKKDNVKRNFLKDIFADIDNNPSIEADEMGYFYEYSFNEEGLKNLYEKVKDDWTVSFGIF